jgi:hypothetical protein
LRLPSPIRPTIRRRVHGSVLSVVRVSDRDRAGRLEAGFRRNVLAMCLLVRLTSLEGTL